MYVVLSDISPSPVTNQSRGRIGSTPTLGHSQYESRYVVLLSIGKPDFQKCWNNIKERNLKWKDYTSWEKKIAQLKYIIIYFYQKWNINKFLIVISFEHI